MLSLFLLALLASPPARPFADERALLDRRLETLRRILPDGPNAPADVQHVREMAQAAGLTRVEIQGRPPVEAGGRGDVILDVSALGRFADVDRFFRQLALSARLADVESLTLVATTEDVTQLSAVVRLPYRPARAPLPPPPESPRGRPSGVSRPVLEAFQRDQALAVAKSETIAAARRTRRNPRLFLSELASIVRDRPVSLGYASLGEEFVVRGLAMGEGPVRALESRFERGFFRIADFLMARQGPCHRFEVRGRAPVVGPDAELPVPVDDPFAQDEKPCRTDRDTARDIVAKGRTPSAKQPGHGPLTVRLRDVDLTDVFLVLSRIAGGGYVVEEEVLGRTSVEVVRATLEETHAAIEKAAGVDISEPGPVRRVSVSRLGRREAPSLGGPATTVSLKRTSVRDFLAAMADVDPALAVLGPPGFLGRLSVWARDVPFADVRAVALETAGLRERVEEGRRIIDRPTGAGDAPVPVARESTEPRLVLQAEELAVMEFDLAGVASDGRTWLAFAYAPSGQLHAYRPGDRLADGVVRFVESTDVLLDTEDGPLRIVVPLLPD